MQLTVRPQTVFTIENTRKASVKNTQNTLGEPRDLTESVNINKDKK